MIVRCEQVSKRFGEKLAVDALDLEVEKGQCFGLLGPNGAGKTTALKMIYGVTPPSAGRILVFDQDITTHTREIRARLGVTLQENALIEVLSPGREPARVRPLPPDSRRARSRSASRSCSTSSTCARTRTCR